MLQFSSVSYTIFKQAGDIDYCFAVRIGGQEWMIHKVYNDFVHLNHTLTQRYGAAALPKLTGSVFIRPVSDNTGRARLPKLEDYVTEVLTTWRQRFKNPRYFELPNPLGADKAPLRVEETMGAFLEIEENYEIDDEEDEEDEDSVVDGGDDDDDDGDDFDFDDGAKKKKPKSKREKKPKDEAASTAAAPPAAAAAEKKKGSGLAWSDDDDAAPPAAGAAAAAKGNATPSATPPSSARPKQKSVGFDPSTTSALDAPAVKPQHQKSKDDDFVEVDAEADTFDSMHVLSQCRTMSGEVDVIVKDYVIHPKQYVAYNFQVTFCGTTWVATKRFSEVKEFHDGLLNELKGTSFADEVPSFEEVMFPAWRKNDKDVADKRYIFFTNYFKIIAPMVDEWFGPTFLTHFKIKRKKDEELDSLERYASAAAYVKVAVNRFLFDFFEFDERLDEFNADSAERVARENERLLPQFMQKNLELVRQEEQRSQKEKNLAYRRSIFEPLSDAEFADLLRIISRFDDDRHALGLIEMLVKSGYYYPGKTRLERVQELDSQVALRGMRAQQQQQQASVISNRVRSGSTNALMSPTTTAPNFNQQRQSTSIFHDDNSTASSTTPAASTSNFNAAPSAAALVMDDPGEGQEEDNFDVFDQMANSALFGAATSTGDFSQLVCTAVEAAKSALRGRANNTLPGKDKDGSPPSQKPSQQQQQQQQQQNQNRQSQQQQNQKQYDVRKLSRPCGLSSTQMAQIAAAIPFNDTRALAIAVMSSILLEDSHLDDVFQTLIYDWDTAAHTLEELLTKKEAPESFKMPDPNAPSESAFSW